MDTTLKTIQLEDLVADIERDYKRFKDDSKEIKKASKKITKEVKKFISRIEKAHKNASKSKLVFKGAKK